MDGLRSSIDLSPEQMKALRGCKTTGEMVERCQDNGVALPDELLDSVAGGGRLGVSGPRPRKMICPKCGSDLWYDHDCWFFGYYECAICGYDPFD